MKSRGAFTKTDAAAALAIAAFLLLTTAFIPSPGRQRAKRAVCLSNLRQLTAAWNLYADDYNGKIVNGFPSGNPGSADPGTGIHEGEIPWVGRYWHPNYFLGEPLPLSLQEKAIKLGALWPYSGNLRLYRCPASYQDNLVTYPIVDSMNAVQQSGTDIPAVFIKTKAEIGKPHARIVFLDEGWTTPGSFAVHFNRAEWWDDPVVRHGDGIPLSFADGHTEYRLWKGHDTVELATGQNLTHTGIRYPYTPEGFDDLREFQIRVWGKLGYYP